jgi:hypothetical protein
MSQRKADKEISAVQSCLKGDGSLINELACDHLPLLGALQRNVGFLISRRSSRVVEAQSENHRGKLRDCVPQHCVPDSGDWVLRPLP